MQRRLFRRRSRILDRLPQNNRDPNHLRRRRFDHLCHSRLHRPLLEAKKAAKTSTTASTGLGRLAVQQRWTRGSETADAAAAFESWWVVCAAAWPAAVYERWRRAAGSWLAAAVCSAACLPKWVGKVWLGFFGWISAAIASSKAIFTTAMNVVHDEKEATPIP